MKLQLIEVPTWYIAGQMLTGGRASDIVNIHYLINSNFVVKFKSAWIKISNKEVQGYISYKISDIGQSIKLFKTSNDNIPNKQ